MKLSDIKFNNFSTSSSQPNIETSLLQKYARSQAKISIMRLKKQASEAKELQSVPKINKISQEIVSLKEGKNDSITSEYANKIVSSSKSSFGFMMHPKQSFLSLVDLDSRDSSDKNTPCLEKNTQNTRSGNISMEIRMKSSQKFPKNKGKAQEKFSKIYEEDIELKPPSIDELRKALMNRNYYNEPQEPPSDMLNMSVIQRNDY